MQNRRNALGRGLDSIISMSEIRTEGSSAISEIPIASIEPNPEQPRTTFSSDRLEELAASIRELGIVQPLTLRKTETGTYQIIAGERRWRAARAAGLSSVPAYVRTASDSEVTEMALIENIQREDLNAIEVALAFKKLIETYRLTQERLSERLGKKRATIANHLRLLKLPAEIQLGLRDHKLDMGHARALLTLDDPKYQLRLYNAILSSDLSVRKVEEMAKKAKEALARGEKPEFSGKKKIEPASDGSFDFFRRQLETCFPTPVKFSRSASGKGKIVLSFANDDELQKLVSLFDAIKQKS